MLSARQQLASTSRPPLAGTSSLKHSVLCRSSSPPCAEAEVATRTDELMGTSRTTMLYEVAEASTAAPGAAPALTAVLGPLALTAGLGLAAYGVYRSFDQGSRPYSGNVGQEYDAWTEEGILEYYWGEHIHLGYYTDAERAAGYRKKDFKQAKYDFIDKMLQFSGAQQPSSILDVGCGFGGTSRYLAKMFPQAQVEGITLSPKQVERFNFLGAAQGLSVISKLSKLNNTPAVPAGITLSPKQVERGTQLAKERGLSNVQFKVMDALKMGYPDNSFDLVWACESGEHMPDKKKYIEEMVRVLKPGGTLVIACWCQREDTPERPLTEQDKKELQFLYDEWAHPYFISIKEFVRLMKGTGQMEGVISEDWNEQTRPSWHHSIWAGAEDPWFLMARPKAWGRTARDILGLLRMHTAFEKGLMQYGMMTGRKALQAAPAQQAADLATAGRQ